MSDAVVDALIGISGLAGGALLALVILFFVKKYGKKRYLYDERQHQISTKARAIGWNVTLGLIMIAWALVIIVDGVSATFFIMTGLYVAHCFTLILTSAYYASQN